MNQHSQSSRRLVRAASVCLVPLFLVMSLLGAARAAVVLSHSGDTDPATEGWTLVSKKPDLHSGEAVDDGGTPAWKIQDSEVINSGGGSWQYCGEDALTSQDIDDLLSQGLGNPGQSSRRRFRRKRIRRDAGTDSRHPNRV